MSAPQMGEGTPATSFPCLAQPHRRRLRYDVPYPARRVRSPTRSHIAVDPGFQIFRFDSLLKPRPMQTLVFRDLLELALEIANNVFRIERANVTLAEPAVAYSEH